MSGSVFNYVADEAIPPYRIVKYGSENDRRAVARTGDTPAGITTDVGCTALGDRIDVREDGETELQLGETVAAGDYLASDTLGKGVKATGAGRKVIAQAKVSGTDGEIIRVNIIRFQIGG
jgi:hypothetical protein